MKILKIILIVLAVIVVIPLIAALFVSKALNYEKTIVIKAPLEVVWKNVSTFDAMTNWTPWKEYDPDMKVEINGTDGAVGTEQVWNSDVEEVGRGSQTITLVNPPVLFQTKLKFYDPYESEAEAYVRLEDIKAGKVLVAWGFKSEMPYPFNVTRLFMDMEGMMDKDFDKGLRNLKQICEQ